MTGFNYVVATEDIEYPSGNIVFKKGEVLIESISNSLYNSYNEDIEEYFTLCCPKLEIELWKQKLNGFKCFTEDTKEDILGIPYSHIDGVTRLKFYCKDCTYTKLPWYNKIRSATTQEEESFEELYSEFWNKLNSLKDNFIVTTYFKDYKQLVKNIKDKAKSLESNLDGIKIYVIEEETPIDSSNNIKIIVSRKGDHLINYYFNLTYKDQMIESYNLIMNDLDRWK